MSNHYAVYLKLYKILSVNCNWRGKKNKMDSSFKNKIFLLQINKYIKTYVCFVLVDEPAIAVCFFHLQKCPMLSQSRCSEPFDGASRYFLLVSTIIHTATWSDALDWQFFQISSSVWSVTPTTFSAATIILFSLCVQKLSSDSPRHLLWDGFLFTLSQQLKMCWDDFACSTYFENFAQIQFTPFPTSFCMPANSNPI